MATGTIGVPNSTKTGSFSPSTGITVNELRVKQVGKVVEVHFYATSSGTFSTTASNEIGTISGVAFPPTNVRKLAGCGTNAYLANKPCYAVIGNNGGINIRPSDAGQNTVNIDFVYTVD